MIVSEKPERKIGIISYASGDYSSYIGAMENFIAEGDYYFINQQGDTTWAGRPPHFTIPYYVARQLTNRIAAADILTATNVLLDSAAITCLAIMAASLLGFSRRTFFLALVLGVFSTYISNWTFITLPDGPAAALLMIGTFFYWKALRSEYRARFHILLASCFFSWVIVLRPYLIVIIFLFALYFLFRKKNVIATVKRFALVSILPPVLLLLPWIIRNYNITGKVIPFQQDVYAGYGYRLTELRTREIMSSMGEDGTTFWDPYAMASYFSPAKYTTSLYQYPSYIKKDTTLFRKLENMRLNFISNFYTRTPAEEDQMAREIQELRRQYIEKYRWRYYLYNPIKRTLTFWGHSGSYYISVQHQTNPLLIANKYLQSILYYAVLIFGTIGLTQLGRRNEVGWILLLPLVILTIMCPLVFGFMEPRYAISFYYPSLVGLVLFIELVYRKVFGKNKMVAAAVPQ